MVTSQKLLPQFNAVLTTLHQLSDVYCRHSVFGCYKEFGPSTNAVRLSALHEAIESSIKLLREIESGKYPYNSNSKRYNDTKDLIGKLVISDLKRHMFSVTKHIKKWAAKWISEEECLSVEQCVSKEQAKMDNLIEQYTMAALQKLVACKEEKCT